VVLRVASGRYAVTLTHVVEVVAMPPITRLPGAPLWLPGAVNWRGRILPVVDLAVVLAVPGAPADATKVRRLRLVVVSEVIGADREHPAGRTLGLAADIVAGIVEGLPPMSPPLSTLPPDVTALIRGQFDDGVEPTAVLDVPALFGLSRLLHLETDEAAHATVEPNR
jgi:chemotaxis signal transduction protein